MNNFFQKRLKEVRNAYRLSGYAFAKKLNIPQPTYLRYETGDQKPSAKLIESLVLLCNVNIKWLYTGHGQMFFANDEDNWQRQNDTAVQEKFSQFGKRLSELQAFHNFLDREMAQLLGVSERHYISVITGRREPDIDMVNKLKQNFKISVEYLLYGE